MRLDSGVVTVWRGTNIASPGGMPTMTYEQIWGSYYGSKTVGVTRYYNAQQHGDRPDAVIQVNPVFDLVLGTDKAVLSPFTHEDGNVYKIVQIQQVTDEDGLPKTDLTLERLEGIESGSFENGTSNGD